MIVLKGGLTFATVMIQRKFLQTAINLSHESLLEISLAGVTHCDSAGLALLIDTKKFAAKRSKKVNFSSLDENSYNLAKFCGIEPILFQ